MCSELGWITITQLLAQVAEKCEMCPSCLRVSVDHMVQYEVCLLQNPSYWSPIKMLSPDNFQMD